MKKIFFILFITISCIAKAQTNGIILSGKQLFNSQDSVIYTTLYTIPPYTYSGYDKQVHIFFPLCRSAFAAINNQVLNFVNLPVLDTAYTSATGYPTTTQLYNVAKAYLNNQGFPSVKTF